MRMLLGIRNWGRCGNVLSESYLYRSQRSASLFVTLMKRNRLIAAGGGGTPHLSSEPGLGYTAIARMLGSLLMAGEKMLNSLSFFACLVRRRSPGSFPWTNSILNQMSNEKPGSNRGVLQVIKAAQQGRTEE